MISRAHVAVGELRSRYAASGLSRFFAWWTRELAGLVPARVRSLLWDAGSRRLLRCVEGRVHLLYEHDGRMTSVAGAAPGDAAALLNDPEAENEGVWLLLAPPRVLCKPMVLPLAAAGRLHSVLAHEIDRQTPFRAGQVSFDVRETGRDMATGQLHVELLVLPLATLDAVLAELGAVADRVEGVEVERAGRLCGVNLLPADRRPRRATRVVGMNLALLAMTLALLGYALSQSLDNRRSVVERLDAQVELQRAEAQRVATLRAELEELAVGGGFFAEARAGRPRVVAVIDDLSRRLPDGTWLERLTISDREVTLVGLSREAPATVGWLQDSPYLRTPALSGPVQPDPRAGGDRFTLTAALASAGEVADAAPR